MLQVRLGKAKSWHVPAPTMQPLPALQELIQRYNDFRVFLLAKLDEGSSLSLAQLKSQFIRKSALEVCAVCSLHGRFVGSHMSLWGWQFVGSHRPVTFALKRSFWVPAINHMGHASSLSLA